MSLNRWEQLGKDYPEILAYLLGQVSHKFVADHRLMDLITLVNSIPSEEEDAQQVNETITLKSDTVEYTVHEFEHAADGVFPSHEIRNSQGDVVIYGDKHRAPVYAHVLNNETAAYRNRINAMAEAIRNARIELFRARAWNTDAYKFLSSVDAEPIGDTHNLPDATARHYQAVEHQVIDDLGNPLGEKGRNWFVYDCADRCAEILNAETARLRSDLTKADQQASAIAAIAIELREQLASAQKEYKGLVATIESQRPIDDKVHAYVQEHNLGLGGEDVVKVLLEDANSLREQLAQQKRDCLTIVENLRETVKEAESEIAMHETLVPQSTQDAQERETVLRRELNATLRVIREAYARLNDSRIKDYDKVALAAEILEPYIEPKEQS
jgi:hypothetical protein